MRALRLAKPRTVPFVARYAGCRSWVPLEGAVETGALAPFVPEAEHEERRERVRSALAPFLDSARSRT